MCNTVADKLALFGLGIDGVHEQALLLRTADVERARTLRLAALDASTVLDLAKGTFLQKERIQSEEGKKGRKWKRVRPGPIFAGGRFLFR